MDSEGVGYEGNVALDEQFSCFYSNITHFSVTKYRMLI